MSSRRKGANAMMCCVLVLLAACSQEQAQTIGAKAAEVHLTSQLDSFASSMANQIGDRQACAGWRSNILQTAEKWKGNPGSAGARYEIIQIRDAAKAAGCVIGI